MGSRAAAEAEVSLRCPVSGCGSCGPRS
uniref:Uncharacterized protein n=1 Tax=Arundo donax TaxID=35708 RepID=A0A0A9FVB7_ARUDO